MVKLIVKGIAGIKVDIEDELNIDTKKSTIKDMVEIALKLNSNLKEFFDERSMKPKPGILVLVNDVDINLILNRPVNEILGNENSLVLELKIIPVNHGG